MLITCSRSALKEAGSMMISSIMDCTRCSCACGGAEQTAKKEHRVRELLHFKSFLQTVIKRSFESYVAQHRTYDSHGPKTMRRPVRERRVPFGTVVPSYNV